ncbi:hypothetical protein BJ742DRAFT_197539 [Cladochytrium replicatum]|nr:hypothetical protein BJ742DRAFT_197539 [Cladochytrium replicatum]
MGLLAACFFVTDKSQYHVKGAPVKNKRKSTPPGLTELTKLVKLAYENETAYLTSLSTQLTKTQPGVIRRQDEAIKIYISRTHEGDERRRRRQATEDVEKAKNDLPSDWNRILSDTCSFSEYLKATKNRESDAQFRVQGLSVDDVFKDKRAKLAYALGENELLHTDYARQLMGKMSLVAAQNMKPHLVSNIAFD